MSATDLDSPCHALHPFGAQAARLGLEVSVTIAPTASGGLRLDYHLAGDLSHIRLPGPAVAKPRDRLWEHTCFEAFLARIGDPAYHEFNFSPSGEWAAYRFHAYRARDAAWSLGCAPTTRTRLEADRISLTAELAAHHLPGNAMRIGLSAVVECAHGRLTYWALAHPADRPDFHARTGFRIVWPCIGDPGAEGVARVSVPV